MEDMKELKLGWLIVVLFTVCAAIWAIYLMRHGPRQECVDYVAPSGAIPPCREDHALVLRGGVAMCDCVKSAFK